MLSIKYVSAEWCAPCKSFWPVVQEICASIPNVNLIKLDVNNPEIIDMNIRSVPTLLYYKNGQLIYKSIGTMSKQQFASLAYLHSR
jgi:thiol-disulfide isomerase/thioredoxin